MDKSKRHLLTVLKADPADVALRQKVLELTKVLEQFNRDGADASGAYIPNSFHFMGYNELMAFHAAAFDAANRACVELENLRARSQGQTYPRQGAPCEEGQAMMAKAARRAALYVRVSTDHQSVENQVRELKGRRTPRLDRYRGLPRRWHQRVQGT